MTTREKTRLVLIIAAVVLVAALALGIFWSGSGNAAHDNTSGAVKRIAIISIPDIHSALLPHAGKNGSVVGGLAQSAAVIRTVRGQYDGSLLLSSGDDMGNDESGMFFKLFHGVPERRAMSAMGFDAGTIGNHDFDERLAAYKDSLGATSFPIIAANIRFDDPEVQSAVRPYIIRDVAGVRIGMFGLSYPDEDEYTPVLDGITINPDIEGVGADMVRQLRAEKADLVIALTHLGKEKDHALARNVDGIDIIVGGHDHIYYIDQVNKTGVRNTVMFDGGVYGDGVSVFSFAYAGNGSEQGAWTVIPVDGTAGNDTEIAALIRPYRDQYAAWSDSPAGSLNRAIDAHKSDPATGQSESGTFVTEAMRKYGDGADIAFCPTGSLNRSTVYTRGTVTNGELGLMIDHNNRLSWIRMPGREILNVLETSASFEKPLAGNSSGSVAPVHPLVLQMSGITLKVDPSQESGRRVSNVRVVAGNTSVPLNAGQDYTVVVNTRIGQFSEGYKVFQDRPAIQVTNTDVRILDTLIQYIADRPHVRNSTAAACATSCG